MVNVKITKVQSFFFFFNDFDDYTRLIFKVNIKVYCSKLTK